MVKLMILVIFRLLLIMMQMRSVRIEWLRYASVRKLMRNILLFSMLVMICYWNNHLTGMFCCLVVCDLCVFMVNVNVECGFFRLRGTFAELANVYYKDEGRKIKTRVEKKSFNSHELNVRYCFKVRVFIFVWSRD
jgi:hypothetical protein